MDPSGVAEDGREADTVPGKWGEEEGGEKNEMQNIIALAAGLNINCLKV